MIREFKTDDYPMLCSWWKEHGWSAVHESLLKPICLIASIEEEDCAACVIWPIAGVGVCLMEYVVTNPRTKAFKNLKAIRQLTEFCRSWCQDNDYQVLMTTCAHHSLAKLHERNGFTMGDKGMNHLFMVVGQEVPA